MSTTIVKKNLINLFVYGTLKKGHPNNKFFDDNSLGYAKFVCQGITDTRFPLVVATKWKLPFLLFAPNVGKNVEGEVYEIDEKFLSWADEFEGHPLVYQRKEISIKPIVQDSKKQDIPTKNTPMIQCWAYFLMKFPQKTLEKIHLSCYEKEDRDSYDLANDDSDGDNIQQALLED